MIFFDPSPRVMKIKTKINKLSLIKLKSSCRAMETINKKKRQPIEWEKIFANQVTNKRSTLKIYKQFMQLDIKIKIKIKLNSIKKWVKDINR